MHTSGKPRAKRQRCLYLPQRHDEIVAAHRIGVTAERRLNIGVTAWRPTSWLWDCMAAMEL